MKQPYFALPNILGMPYYLIFAREHFEGPEDRWKQQAIGTGPFMLEFSDPTDRFEDWGLWKRLSGMGAVFVHVPVVTWHYRFHDRDQRTFEKDMTDGPG